MVEGAEEPAVKLHLSEHKSSGSLLGSLFGGFGSRLLRISRFRDFGSVSKSLGSRDLKFDDSRLLKLISIVNLLLWVLWVGVPQVGTIWYCDPQVI